jgi:hypothetical protein
MIDFITIGVGERQWSNLILRYDAGGLQVGVERNLPTALWIRDMKVLYCILRP